MFCDERKAFIFAFKIVHDDACHTIYNHKAFLKSEPQDEKNHKVIDFKAKDGAAVRKTYLSMSDSRDESRNPFANGLLSIFSLVI